MVKVAYLGPEGSYSSLAAKNLCPSGEYIPCQSFYATVSSVLNGETDCIVLPVENTLQGAVVQNLDLLYAHAELFAVKEYILRIDHRLVTKTGADLSEIKRIFSHEQAILQCGKYISEYLPNAKIIYTDSTAESLSKITEPTDAGIAGAHMAREGFSLSDENIADEKKNFTHFLLVVKGKEQLPAHSCRVYFAASCPHEPGALLKMLQILAVYDLNMTKIESRPKKDSPGEYNFFIEFEGDIAARGVQAALARLKEYTKYFKLLGCY